MLISWQEFLRGKRKRKDVAEFSLHLMDNIFTLHHDLANKTYKHGIYQAFKINDPKSRDIHKASVRDRLVHHAIYRVLYPYFDRKFIYDSYSCRNKKGTHRAMNRFRYFFRKASCNNTKTCWVLKCDIRKFFASIDHKVLKKILSCYIDDADTLWLLEQIIDSFYTKGKYGVGLPLGNLTSQLFINIYMNNLDQFIKHDLKIHYYIRYADDFVIFSHNRDLLENSLLKIRNFLKDNLKLELNSSKVLIKTLVSGVDFLGWIHFPDYRILRSATRRRIFRRIFENPQNETYQSYIGLLQHGNSFKIRQELDDLFLKNNH